MGWRFLVTAVLGPVFLALNPVVAGQDSAPAGVALLRKEAAALDRLVESPFARSLLTATADLPAVASRVLYRDEPRGLIFTEAEARALNGAARSKLKPFPVDESFYYTTKYGSPLAYMRPLEILGRAGVADAAGLKVLDFGYGTIGHLRLLASRGADVTGVDVDPLLRALYSEPGDQGSISNRAGTPGRIRLISGRFPADSQIKSAVGGDYDLIISKNTLKNGYVHPEQPVDRRRLLNLEVNDTTFVRAVHSALKPGGWVMIYNICPAPAPPDKPYKPWADGRCPFPRLTWKAAGFQVIAFDQDDTPAIRVLARALGWDQGPEAMDLNADLFAHYSLLRKTRP